ncbi:Fe-S cluster assembly protein SufD [Paeniroseomonas aquatica]|uniref:Fe-S cluster assembly protein SufD n=1 Tax=Paeniroseomonas aquatica TaxID=373043 RepID=A0ABT8A5A2_9PROT|nr:Fe-S cluster assembly protein SufD [Paeniroseomonas aquatica]MDN3564939.1 Fe-S cluster assembly protein SufD [Paeniroseomonas aquatica]
MNAAVNSGAEGFLHRFDGLRARLPGTRMPWVQALREDAATRFRSAGFPTRRVEAWKYTDLRPVSDAGFDEALSILGDSADLPAPLCDRRAVFVDGRFREDASTLGSAEFAVDGLAQRLPQLEGRLGSLARPQEEPLVALNTMLFEDGLVVTVPAGVAGGLLELASFASGSERPAAFHPRHLIRLEAGASLTIVESARGPAETRYLHNPVFEIEVAEGATLTHTRVQQEGAKAFQLGTIYARVEAGGTYDNFTLNAGGRLVRNEIHVTLAGPRATCHMNGAQLLRHGQHADTTTFLDHAAPDCASRQTYKTVLSGKSRGVFQGKIHVHQVAQRTDGYQMNQALLLSPDAEIDSKPQLEIYADDVKCSHGATVGALDAEQLFYLRARGIPEEAARSMLVQAFLAEAIEGVADATSRAALEAAVSGWWEPAA